MIKREYSPMDPVEKRRIVAKVEARLVAYIVTGSITKAEIKVVAPVVFEESIYDDVFFRAIQILEKTHFTNANS
jgi:hypothetical protein